MFFRYIYRFITFCINSFVLLLYRIRYHRKFVHPRCRPPGTPHKKAFTKEKSSSQTLVSVTEIRPEYQRLFSNITLG